MKKLTKSDKKEIIGTYGKMEQIKDFLPSPKDLVFKEGPEMVKITSSINKNTIEFFKKQSNNLNTSYQRMIRNLLTQYVSKNA